jgi:hypothetical protein
LEGCVSERQVSHIPQRKRKLADSFTSHPAARVLQVIPAKIQANDRRICRQPTRVPTIPAGQIQHVPAAEFQLLGNEVRLSGRGIGTHEETAVNLTV